jgi:diguanylate cyclase
VGFADGVEKAGGYAKQAIDLMNSHDVPPAPPNFAVWYNYVSERFPDLKKTLDQAIQDEKAFDGNQNENLYETFIGHSQEGILLQDAGEEIKEQVQSLLQALGGASSEIDGVSTSIKSNLNSFSAASSLGNIEAFVQNMLQQTRRIQDTNAQLQAQLSQSSDKISALQENLKKAEEESYRDALTNIANRKKFDVTLLAEIADAQKRGSTLCLAIGDIDLFKKFNDNYGHQVGDQVLKLVARALHDNVKGGDLAARYGGEEFALILPATSIDNAFSLVESIRETIGSRHIRNKQKDIDFGSVTLSLGLAQYRTGEAACDFISRADNALYKAKTSGRNKTMRAAN